MARGILPPEPGPGAVVDLSESVSRRRQALGHGASSLSPWGLLACANVFSGGSFHIVPTRDTGNDFGRRALRTEEAWTEAMRLGAGLLALNGCRHANAGAGESAPAPAARYGQRRVMFEVRGRCPLTRCV